MTATPPPPQDALTWTAARVAVDELLGPYPAQIATNLAWNGWAVPRFTLDVAQRIAHDTQTLAAAATRGEIETVHVTGDRVEIVRENHRGGDTVEVVEPDQDGRYRIGAMAWAWLAIDEHTAR